MHPIREAAWKAAQKMKRERNKARKTPTLIKIGNLTVVDRDGRSMTGEEYVRDIKAVFNMAVPGSKEDKDARGK